MNIEKLRASIIKLSSLHPEDDYGSEKCWDEQTEILSACVSDTIHFFASECTDEEFFWLSTVFSDVSEKTQSKELVQAMRSRLAKVTRDNYVQEAFHSKYMREWVDYDEYIRDVGREIDYAEGAIADNQ